MLKWYLFHFRKCEFWRITHTYFCPPFLHLVCIVIFGSQGVPDKLCIVCGWQFLYPHNTVLATFLFALWAKFYFFEISFSKISHFCKFGTMWFFIFLSVGIIKFSIKRIRKIHVTVWFWFFDVQFSSVQSVERKMKIQSELRQYCGWIFSFQCAIIDS